MEAAGYFVTRTMRALELLAFGPASAPQLAAHLGVHPRTARRLLTRLVEEDYVIRRGPRPTRYQLTLRLPAMTAHAIGHAPLPRVAAPWLDELRQQTGLTAHVLAPSYDAVVCLLHSDGDTTPTRAALRELMPCHCTAPGQILLSYRAGWRESVLSRPLSACSPRTITDPARLRELLQTVAARGYAVEAGEFESDRHALAAPIFDGPDAVAAVCLTAPEPIDAATLAGAVTATAQVISGQLTSPPVRAHPSVAGEGL
jgi:IclR family transcriptional regulator, acetate operon repressor